ncbi:MAG: SAM-dependent methyltransferase [Chlorobi bacterium]|nr:SAM-dependent methyltransferase [Chlorobiota bacterium]
MSETKDIDISGITVIGEVESPVKEPLGPEAFDGVRSVIRIFPEFEEGLFRIEEKKYIEVIFFFHKSKGYRLRLTTYSGELKGVFASRSPHRPTMIGATMVYLEKRDGCLLYVKGLDAIDGTPVLDIKPSDRCFSSTEKDIIQKEAKNER